MSPLVSQRTRTRGLVATLKQVKVHTSCFERTTTLVAHLALNIRRAAGRHKSMMAFIDRAATSSAEPRCEDHLIFAFFLGGEDLLEKCL